jgi:hypothetical protein
MLFDMDTTLRAPTDSPRASIGLPLLRVGCSAGPPRPGPLHTTNKATGIGPSYSLWGLQLRTGALLPYLLQASQVRCGSMIRILCHVTGSRRCWHSRARCGLARLVTERVRIAAKGGANAAAKIVALVAGMVAGADSINDMDLLRHSGMGRLFDQLGRLRPLRRQRPRPVVRAGHSEPVLTVVDRC